MRTGQRPWLIAAAVLSALASMYCALWILSAASLASGYCGSNFSLFAEEGRCRQVHIAMILAVVFAVLCVCLGRKARQRVGTTPSK